MTARCAIVGRINTLTANAMHAPWSSQCVRKIVTTFLIVARLSRGMAPDAGTKAGWPSRNATWRRSASCSAAARKFSRRSASARPQLRLGPVLGGAEFAKPVTQSFHRGCRPQNRWLGLDGQIVGRRRVNTGTWRHAGASNDPDLSAKYPGSGTPEPRPADHQATPAGSCAGPPQRLLAPGSASFEVGAPWGCGHTRCRACAISTPSAPISRNAPPRSTQAHRSPGSQP